MSDPGVVQYFHLRTQKNATTYRSLAYCPWQFGMGELMAVVNQQAGTRIDEISDGIYRISTPVRELPEVSLSTNIC